MRTLSHLRGRRRHSRTPATGSKSSDQDQGQLSIADQLQRVGGQLLHRETKTEIFG
ncbi:hypothetical protein AB0J72_50080 [Dactylosporangium sp. NPDC049742]|uniref:hypothetical protein n=1 Tax=Dactylosporangium sp. NPDC049742 TaxID=3154737 RepID=UPI00343A19B4